MWDAVFDYLGAGGGLIVLLNWLVRLPALRKRARQEEEEASRHIAEQDDKTIKTLYDEVRSFQERLAHLEGCLARIVVCPSYHRCPSRHLVQDYKRKYYYPPSGQPRVGQKGKRYPRDNPVQPGAAPGSGGQPP